MKANKLNINFVLFAYLLSKIEYNGRLIISHKYLCPPPNYCAELNLYNARYIPINSDELKYTKTTQESHAILNMCRVAPQHKQIRI